MQHNQKKTTQWMLVIILVIIVIGIIAGVTSYLNRSQSVSTPPALSGAASSTSPVTVSPAHPIAPTYPQSVPVALSSIMPVSGLIGSDITIVGSGFTTDNKVLLDDMVAAAQVPVTSTAVGGMQTLIIKLPSTLAPDCTPGQACPTLLRLVTRGAYNLNVENANGMSNTITYAALNGI